MTMKEAFKLYMSTELKYFKLKRKHAKLTAKLAIALETYNDAYSAWTRSTNQ